MSTLTRLLLLSIACIAVISCDQEYTPKPKAYVRIELPPHDYQLPEQIFKSCPYSFEISSQSQVTVEPRYRDSTCWYNVFYPELRATIHLTYSALNNNLAEQIEDNRTLAMKHISKADAIRESRIENDSARVFGIAYDFRGNTASDYQFFLTDSSEHFLRGALYFSYRPNKDSLGPVIDYVKQDVEHMLQTFRWNSAP